MKISALQARAVFSPRLRAAKRAAKRPVSEARLRLDCLVSRSGVSQEQQPKVRHSVVLHSKAGAAAPGPAQAQALGSALAPVSAAQAVRAVRVVRVGPLPRSQAREQVRFAGPRSSASGSLTAPLTLQSRTPKLLIEPLESI